MIVQHLLVPIDFSVYSEQALVYAIEVAKSFNARLTVLHVQYSSTAGSAAARNVNVRALDDEVERGMQAALERVSRAGLKGERMMTIGVAVQTIVEVAKDRQADLIVMGDPWSYRSYPNFDRQHCRKGRAFSPVPGCGDTSA